MDLTIFDRWRSAGFVQVDMTSFWEDKDASYVLSIVGTVLDVCYDRE